MQFSISSASDGILPACDFEFFNRIGQERSCSQQYRVFARIFLGNLPGVLAATACADQTPPRSKDHAKINCWVVGGVIAALLFGTIAVRKWLGNADRAGPVAAGTQDAA